MHEVFKALKEAAEKDLKEASAKKDLTPSDWTTVKTILSAMCKMDELKMSPDYDDASYRGYPMPYYDDYPAESMRRGRSNRTGRYISRDGWDRGVSGHSITDRMVDLIERMYDSAQTEHERRELDKWINRIRMGD